MHDIITHQASLPDILKRQQEISKESGFQVLRQRASISLQSTRRRSGEISITRAIPSILHCLRTLFAHVERGFDFATVLLRVICASLRFAIRSWYLAALKAHERRNLVFHFRPKNILVCRKLLVLILEANTMPRAAWKPILTVIFYEITRGYSRKFQP